jgi:peptidoglycan/xylan/chitin deacetylase (PgdA/CDA1 family)
MGVITIAFDDGYLSTFDSCAKYLKEKGICATFAIPSDLIGTTLENRPVINKENIETLIRDGHEIASHTTGHSNLLDLYSTNGLEAVQDEMRLSKKQLESLFDINVNTMVFPFIEANQNCELRELSSNYYSSCRITTENLVSNEIPVKDPFSITGVALTHDLPIDEYNKMIDKIEKEDKWLIEVFHRSISPCLR